MLPSTHPPCLIPSLPSRYRVIYKTGRLLKDNKKVTKDGLVEADPDEKHRAREVEWKRLLAYKDDGFEVETCRGICGGRNFWKLGFSRTMQKTHDDEGGPPARDTEQALLDAFEMDHKKGVTSDGHITQLQALCHACNFAKGRLEEYADWRAHCKWCHETGQVLRLDGSPLFKHAQAIQGP